MKHVWIMLVTTLLGAETIDCTQIFENRKVELLREVEKIDEARQSFEALQAATNALFEKQKNVLKEKESALAKTKEQIDAKEKQITLMLEENKKTFRSGASKEK